MRRSSSASSNPPACRRERLEALEPSLGRLGRLEQEAVRLVRPAPHAAAELVELREPEPIGVLDHDRGRVRDVDADLDDRGGDENLGLARGERAHRGRLLGRVEPPVDEPDTQRLELADEVLVLVLGGARLHELGALDQRADHVRLPTVLLPLPDEPAIAVVALAVGHAMRAHGPPPGRHLPELGDVEIAVQPEGQRAGNRRRRHVQGVRAVRLGELGALLDPEAVLLVDDRDEEPVELDPVLEQGVRPDRDGSVAGRQALQPGAALRSGDVSGHELDRQPDRLEQRTKGRGVLLGQRLGGSHHRALTACLDGTHERVCGDDRLARADVARAGAFASDVRGEGPARARRSPGAGRA